ncbi:G-type lectin S-receptor serine/threonine-protein kinase [Trifolium repens]|nr:G-type lectin S-receptor serine/threonine-protein kinase [Trifolium repens]
MVLVTNITFLFVMFITVSQATPYHSALNVSEVMMAEADDLTVAAGIFSALLLDVELKAIPAYNLFILYKVFCLDHDSDGTDYITYKISLINLSCFEGFEPKNLVEWNLRNWTNGCVRRFNLYGNQNKCGIYCVANCSCAAYAYDPYIGCMYWSGELIDLQKFSYGGLVHFIRVPAELVAD